MRRWIGGVVLAVLAACLFGCSASGPRFSEMAQAMPSLGDNEGRIYFYRDSIMGAALQPEVSVNGQVVGKSQPNSFFYIDRPAGSYRATARTEAEATIDIVLRPKQTAYVKMSIGFGLLVGRPAFERMPETEARREIPNLAYGASPAAKAGAGAAPAVERAAASQPPPATPAPARAVTPAPAPAPVVAPAPAAAVAATAAARKPAAPTAPDDTPFARTPLNDLRFLMQPPR
ncbi:DUF2846 domain-containing protein [Variovorax sp. RB3P1]|uniref:DUF2846 domain-containing protein n=1 Tax=Variovorax sp. RB3P1 TaxID=3443732 RepID=UPI003F482E4A